MIPSVYEKHVHNDPDFPFYFHTAMRSEGSSRRCSWHESIELLYLLEGSCCVVCGQKTVRAAAGDLVVINPGALHAISSGRRGSGARGLSLPDHRQVLLRRQPDPAVRDVVHRAAALSGGRFPDAGHRP